MHIAHVSAVNFRALQNIQLKDAGSVNVIVGPNATGKSTLLDAIRMPKSILIPRLSNEAQQTLINFGALSPHNPILGGTGFDLASIANDPENPIILSISIKLSQNEIDFLRANASQLGLLLLQSSLSRTDNDPLGFTQFLSSEEGQKQLQLQLGNANETLNKLTADTLLNITLHMDAKQRTVFGKNVLDQAILAVLERSIPNSKTFFSMFPADRAFPQGEAQIQLGSQDSQQQLLSYMATPALKYNRLKQFIIHNVLGLNGVTRLTEEFNLIFEHLLPGKSLAGINANEFGLLKIMIKDNIKNKVFDIDAMSSGEKGLVLTFLFLRMSMERGGIVMIDEPELHLNSSVSHRIIPFLIDYCIKPLQLQSFICTHSPEIVRAAFERSDCNLYHLRAGNDLTPIRKTDLDEVFEVFERLGSSPADVLFTNGGVFVEGPDDLAILRAGYADLLAGYTVSALGGRGAAEKEVPALQAEEKKNKLSRIQLFIIDGDRKPTKLVSSSLVKVFQLNRYCLENYFLDDDIVYDLLKSHANNAVQSRGLFPSALKSLAFKQITPLAVKECYAELGYESPGLRSSEVDSLDVQSAGEALSARLAKISSSLADFEPLAWQISFRRSVGERVSEIEKDWEQGWKCKCSGKILIDELYKEYNVVLKKTEFKTQAITKMAASKNSEWKELGNRIASELGIEGWAGS